MNKKYILSSAVAVLLLASCADEFDPEYVVEQPVDLAKLAELAEYQPLKEYINREAHPNFKLGAALDAGDFNKKLTEYNVALTNFDEIVAGNAMKFASCVNNKGEMDFSLVEQFVENAKDVGIQIFGHTLAWHSQQQPKWLSSLVPGGTSGNGGSSAGETTRCIVVRGTDMVANPWDNQFFIRSNKILNAGDETKISFRYRADTKCNSGGTQCHAEPTAYIHWAAIGSFSFSEEWQDFETTFKIPNECEGHDMRSIAFNLNDFADANNYYFDDISWTLNGEDLVSNGNCEGEDVSCFFQVIGQGALSPAVIEKYTSNSSGGGSVTPATKVRAYVVHSTAKVADPWDNQFWIMANRVLEAGEKTHISFSMKATNPAAPGTQCHANAGEYIHWAAIGNPQFTTEWTDFEMDFTIPNECAGRGFKSIAFNLNDYEGENDYYFKDISWTCGNEELIINGNAASDKVESFWTKVNCGNPALSTIEEFMEGGSGGAGATYRALAIHATAKTADPWDNQFWIMANRVLEAGENTHISFTMKASNAAAPGTQCHANAGEYIHWAAIGNPQFTTEWTDFDMDFTVPKECEGRGFKSIAFNLNDFEGANDYYIRDLKWTCGGENLLVNGDLKTDDTQCFWTKIDRGNPANSIIEEVSDQPATVTKTFRAIVVRATEKVADPWDNQFWIMANRPLEAGEKTQISFLCKADVAGANVGTQCHAGAGEYIHWAAIGNVVFGSEWKEVTVDFEIPNECAGRGMRSIAFNLNDFEGANNYYFRDLKWTCGNENLLVNGDLKTDDNQCFWTKIDRGNPGNSSIEEVSEQSVPETEPEMTMEEKKAILTNVLDNWIGGMMDATQGYVSAWDAVNEAISGGGNVDGRYDLQHANPADPDDAKNNFYWQDYLGNEDYVRTVIALARKHYDRQENKNGELKLFINDYNLESWWDNNKKLESLIGWINVWEADGVTKIDGIGSQMHISYYENAEAQKSLETHIVRMLELMRDSKKLCRISELDMGYNFSDGTPATLADMTPEMEMKMEAFYKWIIEQYLTIIPADQQYGITQWCLTDSPKGSGWRADTPVGIWDLNWNRKYIYRGWTEGLAK